MRKFMLLISLLIAFIYPKNVFSEKVSDNEQGFQFFVNPVAGPESASIQIFLINEGKNTLEFEFNNSQFYEIIIVNKKNEVVYQFSKGKSFLQAIQQVMLKPGESKVWIDNLNYNDNNKLMPGKYKVNVQLLARTINGQKPSDPNSLKDQAEMIIPEENPIIKNVSISKKETGYMVTGNARPKLGSLYYSVEDGHHEWIAETNLKIGSNYPKWKNFSFEIMIPKGKYPNHLPLILYLYEKDDKGNIIHTYPKVLEE